MMNKGVVYALWDYEAQNSDELSFHEGDAITILRRKDENETEWWWARLGDREGYVPKNLLGVSALSRFPGSDSVLLLHCCLCTRSRHTRQCGATSCGGRWAGACLLHASALSADACVC